MDTIIDIVSALEEDTCNDDLKHLLKRLNTIEEEVKGIINSRTGADHPYLGIHLDLCVVYDGDKSTVHKLVNEANEIFNITRFLREEVYGLPSTEYSETLVKIRNKIGRNNRLVWSGDGSHIHLGYFGRKPSVQKLVDEINTIYNKIPSLWHKYLLMPV